MQKNEVWALYVKRQEPNRTTSKELVGSFTAKQKAERIAAKLFKEEKRNFVAKLSKAENYDPSKLFTVTPATGARDYWTAAYRNAKNRITCWVSVELDSINLFTDASVIDSDSCADRESEKLPTVATIDVDDIDVVESAVWRLLSEAEKSDCLDTECDAYKQAMEITKARCKIYFPELHDAVFSGSNADLFFKENGEYWLYYYNPDANAGGQIVECQLSKEQFDRMKAEPEKVTEVAAERGQSLFDINDTSFFEIIFSLLDQKDQCNFIGTTPQTTGNTYRIHLTCPQCGNSTWEKADDGGYRCLACEEFCYPEDMGSEATACANKELETLQMCTISTVHIKKDTADVLDAMAIRSVDNVSPCKANEDLPYSGFYVYKKADYGWFVYLPVDKDGWEELNAPIDLLLCFQYAASNKCGLICFDGDGPYMTGLPQYDW